MTSDGPFTPVQNIVGLQSPQIDLEHTQLFWKSSRRPCHGPHHWPMSCNQASSLPLPRDPTFYLSVSPEPQLHQPMGKCLQLCSGCCDRHSQATVLRCPPLLLVPMQKGRWSPQICASPHCLSPKISTVSTRVSAKGPVNS